MCYLIFSFYLVCLGQWPWLLPSFFLQPDWFYVVPHDDGVGAEDSLGESA